MSVSLSICGVKTLYRNPLFLTMKDFITYFSERAIITHLCKLRTKVAKSRNKKHLIHLLTDSKKYNYHKIEKNNLDKTLNPFSEYQNNLILELNSLLPPRKKWVKLGYNSRKNRTNSEFLTSNDKNFYSLLKTIKLFKTNKSTDNWLIELDAFVKDIQETFKSEKCKINQPIIYPKLKDEINKKEVNKCRPISLFSLKERIILSITNKFLTNLFDNYFQNSSYAFRSKKNKDNSGVITHHDCIKDIIEFQNQNKDNELWVVECDMEKFYDSVNHTIVKNLFDELLIKSTNDYPNLDLKNAKHIFIQFLDCYAFNKNVPSSENKEYWESYKIPNGEFEWIEKSLLNLKHYSDINAERIGVPQGGALSGLIANIALNEVDKKMKETNVFYIRFCDDMILIHNNLLECETAKKIYIDSLNSLKLVPHPFSENVNLKGLRKKQTLKLPEISVKPFWKGKSKGPYKWDSLNNNGFPWIGFVGYEINNEGNIRVRKKSLHKELKKQKEVVEEIEKAIENGMRKSSYSVKESVINRLIGMSVGRVNLENYEKVSNDMCWKNGFKELKPNKYSIAQIKQLDRNRNKLFYDLIKNIKEPKNEKGNLINSKARQIINYDKPFSYYYQIIERKE